jgi:hypothetical protein
MGGYLLWWVVINKNQPKLGLISRFKNKIKIKIIIFEELDLNPNSQFYECVEPKLEYISLTKG